MIKVIQRNFRQFLKLRNWGWFSLIQKTRPLVGMVDIEVVIQELESAANEAVADVQNEINEKRRLEDENKKLQVSENSLENLRILTFIRILPTNSTNFLFITLRTSEQCL